MHCWRILKDQPKWMERRKQIGGPKTTSNKKQKTKENSSPSSLLPVVTNASSGANEAPAQDSSQRPDGTKKEKKKLRQRSTIEALDYLAAKIKEADALKDLKKEERCNKAFALQEEKIKLERDLQVEKMKLEREKFEFERELEEDKIIAMDLSTIAFEEQQYFQYRKNKILERRLNIQILSRFSSGSVLELFRSGLSSVQLSLSLFTFVGHETIFIIWMPWILLFLSKVNMCPCIRHLILCWVGKCVYHLTFECAQRQA